MIKSDFLSLVATLLFVSGFSSAQSPPPPELSKFMPHPGDYTSQWWEKGFPGVVEGAPWHRRMETGHFGFVLDTETLEIPHLGKGPESPPADLTLEIQVDGKSYRCKNGSPWSRFVGPRLIESGTFFQRSDVTDLEFTAADGTALLAEARLETAAWHDRLGFILAARPGFLPIATGKESFGRVRGGFGLDGKNHFEIPADPKWDPAVFTLEFQAFIPENYQAGKHSPWLVCKNRNELADGNYGILLGRGARPQVRMNIGGGRENLHTLEIDPKISLKLDSWNHLAISYDGHSLRFYANGQIAGEKVIGKKRGSTPGGIAFGRRQDNHGDGYRFRGVIDEIRLFDRVLTLPELRTRFHQPEADRPASNPVGEWTFRKEGRASMTKLREQWTDPSLQIHLTQNGKKLSSNEGAAHDDWRTASLMIDPVSFEISEAASGVSVKAEEFATGTERPVTYEPSLAWHRINLDAIHPILPSGTKSPSNDSIERIQLSLSNPTENDEVARLLFEKTSRGIAQKIGTPITGISAMLRDEKGNPTGIPVQLSKNWHNDPEGGTYAGQWFHGITQIRMPAKSEIKLELTLAYGHWGGVPAASHAQLSLIGWGSNQRWDQSAIGAWGESICFEPEQVQGKCSITDVRPLMVKSDEEKPWRWTTNVGGGDFFRLFDPNEKRVPHSAMKAAYHRQGPCLTEVTYAGRLGQTITHSETVSLARTDDLVRGTYRIRMEVKEPTDFSRFVIFQIGADTYSSTGERKMAIGDRNGITKEWSTTWGDDVYRTESHECTGEIPWISLHEAEPRENQKFGASANRGIVIREWNAKLGGKDAKPWVSERGLDIGKHAQSSTLDILPPPGITRLEPGDFVEATIEHLIVPQFAREYYGPNEILRIALTKHENTAAMILREATGNDRRIEMKTGELIQSHPDIRIATKQNTAEFTLSGGVGYVPLTFSNLNSHSGFELTLDGKRVDQSIHGNDFWQTDYDPETGLWSQTYNLPASEKNAPRTIRFGTIQ